MGDSPPRSTLGGDWQPENGTLNQMVQLLQASLEANVSNEKRKEIAKRVDELSLNGEFCRYLAFIMTESQSFGAPEELRYMGSLVLLKATRIGLKNAVLSLNGLNHVKRSVLQAMSDSSRLIRKSASSLVSTIVTFGRLSDWPELVEYLIQAMDQPNAPTFEGAFLVLEHLCEDCSDQLSMSLSGAGHQTALQILLPKVLVNFRNQNAHFRAQAVRCVNLAMANEFPPEFAAHATDILQGLSLLAQDSEAEVRKEVCVGLTSLLQWRVDVVAPHIASIIEFMMRSINDEDESVAQEAIDFVFELTDDPTVAEFALTPHLQELFSLLLKRSVYSEEELDILGTDEQNDTSIPDKQEDILPSHHGGLSSRGELNKDGSNDDDEDDDEDESVNYFSIWTLRKAAARALDAISQVIPGSVALPILLPMIEERLKPEQPWLIREAAVLTLGALSKGYMEDLDGYLPKLVPYLLQQAQAPETYIRMSALWSISRYGEWLADRHEEDSSLLQDSVAVVTKATTDRNKHIQHGACGTLARLAESNGELLDPFVKDISSVLVQAFETYQVNNKKAMLDTFKALFSSCEGMCEQQVLQSVMQSLWRNYSTLLSSDYFVLHYFETFGAIVAAAGVAAGDMCKPLYERALSYMEGTVIQILSAKDMGYPADEVDREFLYASLELLSDFASGLKGELTKLVDFNSFLPLFREILHDQDDVTMMDAFTLCGDLAIAVPNELAPLMPFALSRMEATIYPPDGDVDTVNNAVWAIGEIAAKLKAQVRDQASGIVNKLVLLVSDENVESKIIVNAAIALARIAMSCPDIVAPHLESCGAYWASAVKDVVQSEAAAEEEKQDLLTGFVKVVELNPHGMAQSFSYLCLAVVTSADVFPDAIPLFASPLSKVKGALQANGQWNKVFDSLNAGLRKQLEMKNLIN